MKILIDREDLEEVITDTVLEILRDEIPKLVREANQKEWLTSKETAKYLSCSTRHLQYLRDTGAIAFTQDAKTIRYHIDDIKEFLNERKINTN